MINVVCGWGSLILVCFLCFKGCYYLFTYLHVSMQCFKSHFTIDSELNCRTECETQNVGVFYPANVGRDS